jgi:hypothetical protein
LRGLKLVIVAALGLGLALYLLVYVGFGAVVSAAASVGWGGFAVLCLCALAMCPLLAAPWYGLLPAGSASAFRIFVWARMVREAATDVLPFSQLGGLVLGARAAILHGVPAPMAFASTIVDVTTELLAQVGYIALGFAILSMHVPRTPLATSLTRFFALGFALALVAGAVFLALQWRKPPPWGLRSMRSTPRAHGSRCPRRSISALGSPARQSPGSPFD